MAAHMSSINTSSRFSRPSHRPCHCASASFLGGRVHTVTPGCILALISLKNTVPIASIPKLTEFKTIHFTLNMVFCHFGKKTFYDEDVPLVTLKRVLNFALLYRMISKYQRWLDDVFFPVSPCCHSFEARLNSFTVKQALC